LSHRSFSEGGKARLSKTRSGEQAVLSRLRQGYGVAGNSQLIKAMQTPCSDHVKTKGLIYFARMLDKIRLKAAGKLPDGYFTGLEPDSTVFDARCTRFLGIDYDELKKRTLQGGTNEEILEWCFQNGRRPNEEDIEVWNGFILKRGWRDGGSEELAETKKREGLRDRDDIQTFVDYHDADEGRAPRRILGEGD
jgi:hypothetical protein